MTEFRGVFHYFTCYINDLAFSSFSLSYQGQSLAISADSDSKISALGAEALANIRLEKFLLFGGVNYTSWNYKAGATASGKTEISPNIGITLGASLFPKNHYSIDFFMRALGVKLKTTSTSGDILDFGSGYLNSYSLGGTYYFD